MPRVLTATLPSAFFWIAALTLLRVLYLFWAPVPLSGDEAQYWAWAQQLDWGYYSKPPLIAWLISLTTVFSDAPGWVRLASPLAHGLTALMLLLTAARLCDARTGFWVGLGYATLPAVFFSSVLISTDVPLLLFLSIWLWACVMASSKAQPGWLALAGLALGLGALSKYAALFLLPAYAAHIMGLRAYRAGGIGLLLLLLLLLPNLLWNIEHGFVTVGHTADNIEGGGFRLNPVDALRFLGEQAGVIGVGLMLLALVLAYRWSGVSLGQNRQLLLWSLLPLLLICGQALLARANANWGVSAYIGGMVLLGIAAMQGGLMRWFRRAVLLNIVLALPLLSLPWVVDSLPLKQDFLRKIRGHEALATELAVRRATLCPDCHIITRDRMLSAWLLYYGRDFLDLSRLAVYEPRPTPSHHFSFCCRLNALRAAQPFLYIGYGDEAALYKKFAVVRPLEPLTITPRREQTLTFTLVYLDGYKGDD